MEKTLKGKLDFEVILKDDSYSFNYDQTSLSELGALMAVREILKYSKETLMVSTEQATGKHLNLVKDRLQKVSTAEYTVSMMIESVIGEFLEDEILQTVANETEPLVQKIDQIELEQHITNG